MINNKVAWRDVYYDNAGIELSKAGYNIMYVSHTGSKAGNGTKNNPYSIKRTITVDLTYAAAILSAGYGNYNVRLGGAPKLIAVGQSMYETEVNMSVTGYMSGNSQRFTLILKDLKLTSLTFSGAGTITIYNCQIGSIGGMAREISYCKITGSSWGGYGWNNSYVYVLEPLNGADVLKNNLSTFESCKIRLTQDDLNNHKDKYIGFDRCLFMIGNETEYERVSGRDEFERRCIDAGLTIPDITEFGTTAKMGRWIWADYSTIEGRIVKGSEMDTFQKNRFVKMGYNPLYYVNLPISIDDTHDIPNAITPRNPMSDGIEVLEGEIRLKSDVSLIEPRSERIASKIVWLRGKCRITGIDIIENMLAKYGVALDSTPSLGAATDKIEENANYIIRSANEQLATVQYNGVEYSSSLSGNNILQGVHGVSMASKQSANAIIYPVLDYAGHRTVRMRVVDDIPHEEIRSGSLLPGYWYMVVPDNNTVRFGYVVVDGVYHSSYDSFLVGDITTFSVIGLVHLRRCWRQEPSGVEDVDAEFWRNKQQPKWCDVVVSDMRCLMVRNASASGIMQSDASGNYITSGHPLFYNSINGDSGVYVPAYPITGAYIQLELVITTLNPM